MLRNKFFISLEGGVLNFMTTHFVRRKNWQGFSIVEFLVVIAITAILFAGSLVSLSGLRITSALSAGASTVKLTLEKSRLSALVKEDGSGYKVKFNETGLVMFKGAVYDPNDPANKAVNLPPGVKITSVNLSAGGDTVYFSHLTGTTTPGTIVLTAVNDLSRTRTVYIEGSGRVYHVSAASGSGGGGGSGGQGQVADGGQQSFDLGWSIQDTSELKFNFLATPPHTEIFIMQPHFNGSRTVFNYVGYFGAGGITQKISIYSNQLSPTDTVLSITREPPASGPTLEIFIDNRLIATYFSDGTVSAGPGGGIMITQ